MICLTLFPINLASSRVFRKNIFFYFFDIFYLVALKKQEKVEEEEKDVEAGGREDTADDAAPKEPVWTRDASHDHIFIGVPKTYCQ